MKQRIQNLEYRTCTSQPRADCENRDDRAPRKAAGGGKPEVRKREEAVGKHGYLPDRGWFLPDSDRLFPDRSRCFPGLPASSRLFPHKFFWQTRPSQIQPGEWPSGAWNHCGKWSAGVLEYWVEDCTRPRAWNYGGKSADFCAMFHENPRKFAQIRAVVTRLFGFLRVRPIFNNEGRK